MTYLAPAVQGDIGDSRVATLKGVTDLLTASEVEAHIWGPGAPMTLPTSITDPVLCTVEIDLDGWLATAKPGDWFVEVQVTFGDGTVLTWPSGTPARISVRRQGA